MITKEQIHLIIVYESLWFLTEDLTTELGKKQLLESMERIVFTYGNTRLSEIFGIKKEEVPNALRQLLTLSKQNFLNVGKK